MVPPLPEWVVTALAPLLAHKLSIRHQSGVYPTHFRYTVSTHWYTATSWRISPLPLYTTHHATLESSFISYLRGKFVVMHVNFIKVLKTLQPQKQRRRRHARYAFHVRLENSRLECEAENSVERRAAARATLALRLVAATPARPAKHRHTVHNVRAHLYLHPSMKYSHPTHDLFTSGRSRVRINIKQPRVNDKPG